MSNTTTPHWSLNVPTNLVKATNSLEECASLVREWTSYLWVPLTASEIDAFAAYLWRVRNSEATT